MLVELVTLVVMPLVDPAAASVSPEFAEVLSATFLPRICIGLAFAVDASAFG